ncbi:MULTISPECIES: hypothetical protein [unclassified Microbulbifer]|uniref:hypothetical protein n=1 Tax=unclassified Microbulbifer TaxID=2619833 RepID=UPI0027E520BD|nr:MULTISPECIES: hypothetical protein [unclassified Microbulbifer]
MGHQELIQIIIGYTCVGAFVFTVVITCLSLAGWVKLANSDQQKKLFTIIIVEIALVGVGYFSGVLKFGPQRQASQLAVEFERYELSRSDPGHTCPPGMLCVREFLRSKTPVQLQLHRMILNSPPVRSQPIMYENAEGLLAFNYCVAEGRKQKIRAMVVAEGGDVAGPYQYSVDASGSIEINDQASALSRR